MNNYMTMLNHRQPPIIIQVKTPQDIQDTTSTTEKASSPITTCNKRVVFLIFSLHSIFDSLFFTFFSFSLYLYLYF